MDWNDFRDFVTRDDCFDRIEAEVCRNPRLRPDLPRWLELCTLDSVQDWAVHKSAWVRDAVSHDVPEAETIIKRIFERRLLNLETRVNPEKLLEFWAWAVDLFQMQGTASTIWSDKAANLAATFVRVDEKSIAEQEAEFAQLLRRTADELERGTDARGSAWAVTSLRRLAQERRPERLPVSRTAAHVVFAWDDPELLTSKTIRPGILADIVLHKKPGPNRHEDFEWLSPANVFRAGLSRDG